MSLWDIAIEFVAQIIVLILIGIWIAIKLWWKRLPQRKKTAVADVGIMTCLLLLAYFSGLLLWR